MSEWNGKSGLSRTDPIKDCAADWLWRQQSGEWSAADQATFEEWLAHSRYHLVAYWRLKAAWERAERLAALRPACMRPGNTATTNGPWRKPGMTAAALLLAAVALAGTFRWSSHEDRYETMVGQRETIRLADGSQIELNTNSAISVAVGMLSRKVELLKGEAYFKIHHDEARPFTVLAAGHRITDLGTEFSVRTAGDRLEVTLVQGRARLEAVGDAVQHHATDLTPGEFAVATAESISVSKLPQRTLGSALAWRQGKLVFSHVTLAEAVAEFNRYNRSKLSVDTSAADFKVSGTFDAGSVGPFTEMAKLAFGLRVQQRNHTIILSRDNARPVDRNN